ncbi:MAG TPA: phosphoglucomutase [Elusimicrobia bacterium]|nr:MAG: phosphoglucomutase [Elusimicrobia bacterium RIFOXYA12_FULL_49_49]OGS14658.1 MAG: phosphoglucomutase [Elusimicrobia bacterium RIFOXYA2_FULL_47_53]OGS25690.1 MAG: phosphoglucomutase [Elusimicrobia bacterium RIFOXYB12_FULL_50_12]OGS31749.1 MAG: phosphoglucomutase [Elusimicrobia bacterium RIFOXYB2_FULL_46_23]HBU69723.1 phosphoglucomutase [Elusimicrobiota bacterium]
MIKFGTSGWRGIIADEFTFDNVRLVSQAIADYVKSQKMSSAGVVVGYDTRFLSEDFARATVEVLAGNGIKAFLCKRDTPTPVIAFEIIRRKAGGGVNFTASHNPPQYNGIKFSPAWGGPALPETTRAIEASCGGMDISQVKRLNLGTAVKDGLVDYIDPRALYFKRIKELVDFKAIKKANLKIATDDLYGTAIGYLDEMLDMAGVRQKVINNKRDVLFGGHAPEPSIDNLKDLKAIVRKESCHLGLSADGDADRFGIIDSDGAFINPNQVVSLLFYHLVKSRGWNGVVARSVMTTHLIDRLAEKFGVKLYETPVGFKYIGEVMMKEWDKFIIGGEESGGLTIRGHVPEKDGILACLLVAEMVAVMKKPVKKILQDIEKLVGPVYSERLNFHLSLTEMAAFRERLAERGLPSEIGGQKIEKTVTLDGYKFILADGSWFGVRLSGTEPVVRVYLETDSAAKMKKLESAGMKFVKGR